VDRRPHQRCPHCLSLGDQVRQLLRLEPVEPRPQGDVRIAWHLRLHTDEMLDRLGDRPLLAAQQELSCQQRAVERALAQRRACQVHA
jgi:hypothetical protein